MRRTRSPGHFVMLFAAFVAVAAVASSCKGQESENAEQAAVAAPAYDTEPLVIVSPDGTERHFNVEIASTPDSIARGLMFRESMPEDHGMLFMFPREREANFWMRNTLIPLDMVFINEDGTIRHIHENAMPLDETPVPSTGPVLQVLELNGGIAAKLGLKPGDMVYLGAPGK